MLDRKEEHLDTGNRPSAAAQIKAGVMPNGMLTAFDAQSWGTGGAGARLEFPAAVHLSVPESAPDAQRRLHQRGSAARDARARSSTGMLPHRNPDGRTRRSSEMDPVAFRIKNAPPDRPNAKWRAYLPEAAQAVRLGQAPSDRRRDPGAGEDRLRLLRSSMGRRRPRHAGPRGHRERRQRRREVRHTGSSARERERSLRSSRRKRSGFQ